MKNEVGEMVLHETVCMQLSRYVREIGIRLLRGSCFTLEWWLIRSDGALFRHVTGISSEAELIEFSALDPYEERLRYAYEAIRNKYATASTPAQHVGSGDAVIRQCEFARALERVSTCTTESELIDSVRQLATSLGCDRFVYQWMCSGARGELPGDAIETHYISSRPVGLPEYIDRAWYMNDPYVQHACVDARPMLTAAAHVAPSHWLVADARRHGFGNGLIMPCHRFRGDGAKLVGLLHLCSNEAKSRRGGECELWSKRSLILVLGCELMEWRIERIRQRAVVEFHLTEEEIQVLKIIRKGGNAKMVAAELGVALNAVNKSIYHRIKLKMSVKTISEAVGKASSVGLLNNRNFHHDRRLIVA
jgi:DNA-binding CsgD family transcriptional regulator